MRRMSETQVLNICRSFMLKILEKPYKFILENKVAIKKLHMEYIGLLRLL